VLGYGSLRLLPKARDLRPIANLARPTYLDGRSLKFDPINRSLERLFQVLRYEVKRKPELLGSSVWGLDDIYFKFAPWVRGLKRRHSRGLPLLYVACIDIQKCFDSIPHGRMHSVAEDIILEDEYLVHRYVKLATALGQPRVKYSKEAATPGEFPTFFDLAETLAGKLHDVVLTDQVTYPYVDREELSKLLKEHLFQHLLKVGPTYCWQVRGIPQGSILSSLLCNCFYGAMEKEEFTPDMRGSVLPVEASKFDVCPSALFDENETVLMRLTDDYLMLTTTPSTAKSFVSKMHVGLPAYGCYVNPSKTVLNFDLETMGILPQPSSGPFVAWCGLKVNYESLEVQSDYSRYFGVELSSTLTVVYGKNPAQAFFRKLCGSLKAKLHPILLDTGCFSLHCVGLNLYQMLLLSAAKGHCMIKALKKQHVDLSPSYIRCAVHGVAEYASVRIQSLVVGEKFKAKGFVCEVSRGVVEDLNLMAWLTVLKTRHGAYKELIALLNVDLRRTNAKLGKEDQALSRSISDAEGPWPTMLQNMLY